jgi:hypothetical protein
MVILPFDVLSMIVGSVRHETACLHVRAAFKHGGYPVVVGKIENATEISSLIDADDPTIANWSVQKSLDDMDKGGVATAILSGNSYLTEKSSPRATLPTIRVCFGS